MPENEDNQNGKPKGIDWKSLIPESNSEVASKTSKTVDNTPQIHNETPETIEIRGQVLGIPKTQEGRDISDLDTHVMKKPILLPVDNKISKRSRDTVVGSSDMGELITMTFDTDDPGWNIRKDRVEEGERPIVRGIDRSKGMWSEEKHGPLDEKIRETYRETIKGLTGNAQKKIIGMLNRRGPSRVTNENGYGVLYSRKERGKRLVEDENNVRIPLIGSNGLYDIIGASENSLVFGVHGVCEKAHLSFTPFVREKRTVQNLLSLYRELILKGYFSQLSGISNLSEKEIDKVLPTRNEIEKATVREAIRHLSRDLKRTAIDDYLEQAAFDIEEERKKLIFDNTREEEYSETEELSEEDKVRAKKIRGKTEYKFNVLHQETLRLEVRAALGLRPDENIFENNEFVMKMMLEEPKRESDVELYTRELVLNLFLSYFQEECHFEKEVEKPALAEARLSTLKTTGGRPLFIFPRYKAEIKKEAVAREKSYKWTLREFLIPVAKTLETLCDICPGFVHRDIKPDNFIFTKDGVKMLDFGAAKIEQGSRDSTLSVVVGTANYMSPEQTLDMFHNVEKAELDFRSDISSLGKTLNYFLIGEEPYPKGGNNIEIMNGIRDKVKPFAPLNKRYEHVFSKDLTTFLARHSSTRGLTEEYKGLYWTQGLVAWMCQYNKEDRPDSYAKIYEDADAILRGEVPTHLSKHLEDKKIKYKDFVGRALELGDKQEGEKERIARAEERTKYRGNMYAGAVGALPGIALYQVGRLADKGIRGLIALEERRQKKKQEKKK